MRLRRGLPRWSGALLTPRTRTRPAPLRSFIQNHHVQQRYLSTSLRLQSLATAPAVDSDSSSPDPASAQSSLSQPRNSAKLAALHARLALPSKFPLSTLARTLIDRTADASPHKNNSSLSHLGSCLLGYLITEHLICRYPRLPMAVIFAATNGFIGPMALENVAHEIGVERAAAPGSEVDPGLLQFTPRPPTDPHANHVANKMWRQGISSRITSGAAFREADNDSDPSVNPASSRDPEPMLAQYTRGGRNSSRPPPADMQTQTQTLIGASAAFVRALVGALYLHAGLSATKAFFRAHILSRHLSLASLFEFRQPTRDLSRLCAREGFEAPIGRLVSETGRLSRHPVFVVGVYSGHDKLGEGSGASIDEARSRAAVAALKSWYLYSPLDLHVPSDTQEGGINPLHSAFSSSSSTSPSSSSSSSSSSTSAWKPVMIDGGEIIV
ncbi:MAG: hypothetical protein M1825_004499 [Sarcosagium campestre]|nr:MAG: hypothetical protein M1825_004499 [Sarcosagium campestre]